MLHAYLHTSTSTCGSPRSVGKFYPLALGKGDDLRERVCRLVKRSAGDLFWRADLRTYHVRGLRGW